VRRELGGRSDSLFLAWQACMPAVSAAQIRAQIEVAAGVARSCRDCRLSEKRRKFWVSAAWLVWEVR
jgi:hypothetical protein